MGLLDNSNAGTPAIVSGTAPVDFPFNTIGQITVTRLGELRVAQALPFIADIVRRGKSYKVRTAAAFAALTAIPTTVAALSIYNGELAGGLSYVIDRVFAVEIVVDATQQNELAIFGMINKVSTVFTPVVDTLSANIRNLTGKGGNYNGNARVAVGGTVVDDGWMPLGNSAIGAATVAGGAWRNTDIILDGEYIVRPGAQFSLHCAKIAATAAQIHIGIRYHEVQLDLG